MLHKLINDKLNCHPHKLVIQAKFHIKNSLFFIFFGTYTQESSRFKKLRSFILALYRRSFFIQIRPLVALFLVLYALYYLTIES